MNRRREGALSRISAPYSGCFFISSPLGGVELAGLVEDGVRDLDLADVVEEAGDLDVLQLLLAPARALGHGDGQLGDPRGMAERVGVPGVDGRGHDPDRRDVGLFELLGVLGQPVPLVGDEPRHLVEARRQPAELVLGEDRGGACPLSRA